MIQKNKLTDAMTKVMLFLGFYENKKENNQNGIAPDLS
ncbi:hypothetical protein RU93_GL000553 [Enterococcus aquimarinus]|uniref:Uncharacterized protein n=1 Tax=Enterococcus aquimarinus TaxID=328396 RepID=A0A1L8QQD9_9ENTE|nr:hypothetical protein RU93_GL000553 [Enterococcus aquimarinus]